MATELMTANGSVAVLPALKWLAMSMTFILSSS
jgi:hypothetical protein